MMDIPLSIWACQRSIDGAGFITMTTPKSWDTPVQGARNALQIGCLWKKGIRSSIESWMKPLQTQLRTNEKRGKSDFDVYSIDTFLFILTFFFISLIIYIYFD